MAPKEDAPTKAMPAEVVGPALKAIPADVKGGAPADVKAKLAKVMEGGPPIPEDGAYWRGLGAAMRSSVFPAAKTAMRTLGANRPLAFASEGGVAAQSMIPKSVYYGAWAVSGAAVLGDIGTRTMDAPDGKEYATAAYWTAFHVPASLVIPAAIIHKVVDGMEHSMANHSYAKSLPPRVKVMAPVLAALVAILPVVPVVDHLAEMAMEPTLGAFLGLEFEHHHGDSASASDGEAHEKNA